MSRKMCAVLIFGLFALAGCGDKPAPTTAAWITPDTPTPPPPPPPPSNNKEPDQTPPPKVEPPNVVWELDPAKHAIPATPVRGVIGGIEATPEVLIENGDLVFRVPKPGAVPPFERQVVVKFNPDAPPGQPPASILDRKGKVVPTAPAGKDTPVVWLDLPPRGIFEFASNYALTFEIGPRKDGKVTGKVYLALPDPEKTFLAGTFTLNYVRGHTERPGPDDAPYITGDVQVTGADSKAQVRVGYAAFPPDGQVFTKELAIAFDPAPEGQSSWVRDDSDKPRVSTQVAGDGKARPGRYEHVKLPPGRYLLVVGVEGGPSAGKWVDVTAGGALTENLTFDATKAGKIEVTVPPGVTGKALAVPADDPARTPLAGDLFQVAALVFRGEADVIAGKATLERLSPGKYEVRVGPLRGTVEVVAGKTADLTLK